MHKFDNLVIKRFSFRFSTSLLYIAGGGGYSLVYSISVLTEITLLTCDFCIAVPTPPVKEEKEEKEEKRNGEEDSSGEENSEDEETHTENAAASDYQVPSSVGNSVDYFTLFTSDSARSKIANFFKRFITNWGRLNNTQHHSKVLLKLSFPMNGLTLGFCTWSQKLENFVSPKVSLWESKD